PEIDPLARPLGQVDMTLALTGLDDRGDEKVRANVKVVGVLERARIAGIVVEARPQHGLSEARRARVERVEVGQQPIAKPDPVADDRQYLRMQPRCVDFAAFLPRIHDEARAEGAALHPADEELRIRRWTAK